MENTIDYAFVLGRAGVIEPRHPPPTLHSYVNTSSTRDRNSRTLKAGVLLIRDAFPSAWSNRTATARELGINPSALFRKIRLLGVELPEPGHYPQNKTYTYLILQAFHAIMHCKLRVSPDGKAKG